MKLDQNSKTRPGTTGMVGASLPMQRVYGLMQRVGAYRYPVMIVGERGTGKELTARSIHSQARKDRPFVRVDCASLAPAFLESVLLGHGRGAVGRTTASGLGLLSAAEEGTLFLDEVAALPLEYQDALQHVLEQNQFRPAGSPDPLPFNARVISASSCDLESRVKAGAFRQELCLLLNTMQIKLPPLRDRKTDIPLLVDSFARKYAQPETVPDFSEAALNRLLAYSWPGNVRELEQVVQKAVSLATSPVIQAGDLALPVRAQLAGELPLEGLPPEIGALLAAAHTNENQSAAGKGLRLGSAGLSFRVPPGRFQA